MKTNLLRRRRACGLHTIQPTPASTPARPNPTLVPLETGAYKLEACLSFIKRIRINRQDVGKVDDLLNRLEQELSGIRIHLPSPRKAIPTVERPAPNLESIETVVEDVPATASNIHLAVTSAHKWVRFITEESISGQATIYLHPLYPFSRFRILATDGIRAIIAPYDNPTQFHTIVHCTNLTEEKEERDINEEKRQERLKARTPRTKKVSYNIEDLL